VGRSILVNLEKSTEFLCNNTNKGDISTSRPIDLKPVKFFKPVRFPSRTPQTIFRVIWKTVIPAHFPFVRTSTCL
jgi:hypothetical protein